MSQSLKIYLIALFLLPFAGLTARPAGYHYQRPLGNLSAGWYKISMPDGMFEKIKTDLSDIRIFGVNEKGDTIAVPYITDVATGSESDVNASFNIINPTHNASGYSYTFDVPTQQTINQITLHFEEQNFDWKVTLTGSQDMVHWLPVTENYRILAIKNQLTDYGFTTLRFPDTKYRYYKLQIASATQPHLLSAQVLLHVIVPGSYNQYSTKLLSMRQANNGRTMIADLAMQRPEPVSYLKIGIGDSGDYERPFVLQYLSDSVKTEKGWIYNYTDLTQGVLSSVETNEFKFKKTVCSRLRLTIQNGDNPKLTVNSFVVRGYVYSLYAHVTQTAVYYMVYGNENASAPDFDLNKFKNKIPNSTRLITPGNEIILPGTDAPVIHPLIENKAWLWAVMGCIILLLGWFTLKMIHSRDNS